MATLLSPDMLPEDIRNMDFGQASMPHAPEAQTPEVPCDTTRAEQPMNHAKGVR